MAVHLDMDGADSRAIGHHAEVANEMLDRVVGKERHARVGSDAAPMQDGADATRELLELTVAHRPPVIGTDEPCFGRIAVRRPADPLPQQPRTGLQRHQIISICAALIEAYRALRASPILALLSSLMTSPVSANPLARNRVSCPC